MHIDVLLLPRLLKTTLRKNGVSTVERLTAHNRDELLALMGVAELSVERIEAALEASGLALGDHLTMVKDQTGRSVRKERPLTAAQVEPWLLAMAHLRKQGAEKQAEVDLLREIAAT